MIRQREVGACDFVDVLEEAALGGRPTRLCVRGSTEIDRVLDVVTEGGRNFADLARLGRVPVGEIEAIERVR